MNSRTNEKHPFLQLPDLCSLVRELSLKLRPIEDPIEDVKSLTTWIIPWVYVNLICTGAGKKGKLRLMGSCGWESDVNNFLARSDSSSVTLYAEKFIERGRFQLKHTVLNEPVFYGSTLSFHKITLNSHRSRKTSAWKNCMQFIWLSWSTEG